ncbi:hypothetical protein FHT32_006574 [Variovorax sp. SG517]|nr:hypothetical protein [Variovorax sp. SG517]NVM92881.1 hypothetical protein [Variovorax sp. SG517]
MKKSRFTDEQIIGFLKQSAHSPPIRQTSALQTIPRLGREMLTAHPARS